MYTIDVGNMVVVPIDFNIFYESAQKYRKNIRYSKECTISESFFDELFLLISEKTDKNFVIDMKNIVSYPTRLFTRLEKYLERIIFFNIMAESKVKDRISEDLEQLQWINNSIAYCSNKSDLEIEDIVNNQCAKARQSKNNEIIRDLVHCDENKMIHLESSGLYSNCYVDVKRLFLDVEIHTLAWSLSMGTDIGGSATPIGASANVVGTSVAAKEGHPVGWGEYCAKVAPATILVLIICTVWIFVRYL